MFRFITIFMALVLAVSVYASEDDSAQLLKQIELNC